VFESKRTLQFGCVAKKVVLKGGPVRSALSESELTQKVAFLETENERLSERIKFVELQFASRFQDQSMAMSSPVSSQDSFYTAKSRGSHSQGRISNVSNEPLAFDSFSDLMQYFNIQTGNKGCKLFEAQYRIREYEDLNLALAALKGQLTALTQQKLELEFDLQN